MRWLVQLYNGSIIMLAYVDAIFTLAVLYPLCGLIVLYDAFQKGLSHWKQAA